MYAVGGDDMTSTVVCDATRRPLPPAAAAGGGAGAGAGAGLGAGTDPSWNATEVPALPAGVSDAAAAWLRGRLYLTGGEGSSHKHVLCGAPAAGPGPGAGWRRVGEMLAGRSGHAAVVLDGALYVLGGLGGGGQTLASVERYDPDQDAGTLTSPVSGAWVAVAPMTAARTGFAVAVLGGRIVAVGGFDGSNALRSCERYEPATDKWEALPDMPTARSCSAATVLGGRLWVTGGYGTGDLATVEVLDPATNAWDRSKSPMVTERKFHALEVLFGELHAIGGFSKTSAEKYDAQADRWSPVPAMALPEGRNITAWAVLDCPWRKVGCTCPGCGRKFAGASQLGGHRRHCNTTPLSVRLLK
jgi:N-acetylneuraminic acid mutarotase